MGIKEEPFIYTLEPSTQRDESNRDYPNALLREYPSTDVPCVPLNECMQLRNEFNFWNVHGIMNTLGLLQSLCEAHEHSKN